MITAIISALIVWKTGGFPFLDKPLTARDAACAKNSPRISISKTASPWGLYSLLLLLSLLAIEYTIYVIVACRTRMTVDCILCEVGSSWPEDQDHAGETDTTG